MKKILSIALLLSLFGLAAAQDVRVDGSSTVYPIALSIAEEFSIEFPDSNVSVAFSGSGGGFEKFAALETQISNASRLVRPSEIEEINAAGREFVEIPVAFDALTVVVNLENDWAQCMTVEELNMMWRADSGVTTWADVRDGWPDEEIEFYAPGVDSGTFDYFNEAILNDGEDDIRTDFFPSEDDNVLVQGVEGNPYAISFFGYAYYLEEEDLLNAVEIDDGNGCVAPSTATIEDGSYTPLARPLFTYVAVDAADSNPVVEQFIEYWLSPEARPLIAATGYAVLSDVAYEVALERFQNRVTGSPFNEYEGTVLEIFEQEGTYNP
jgi:phosphate transport system substrate-binding protein